eukprot:3457689-Rhodomonas_salina.1
MVCAFALSSCHDAPYCSRSEALELQPGEIAVRFINSPGYYPALCSYQYTSTNALSTIPDAPTPTLVVLSCVWCYALCGTELAYAATRRSPSDGQSSYGTEPA